MADQDALERTAHAQNAQVFTLRIVQSFRDKAYGPFKLLVEEPQETTAGGAQARQSMLLVQDSARVMAGWLDSATREAELRPYDRIKEQYSAKEGGLFPLTRPQYEQLVQDLVQFFASNGFNFVAPESAAASDKGSPEVGASSNQITLVIGAALLIAGLALGFLIARL